MSTNAWRCFVRCAREKDSEVLDLLAAHGCWCGHICMCQKQATSVREPATLAPMHYHSDALRSVPHHLIGMQENPGFAGQPCF